MAAYRDMPHPIPFLIAFLAATFPPAIVPTDSDPIARLDDCIQRRFLGTGAFGMSRVLPNRYHGVAQFQPENPREQQVLTDLAANRYQVVVFVAGRHVLDRPPVLGSTPRYGLQGPAFVANVNAAVVLPDRELLLADSRQAMQFFAGDRDKVSGLDRHRGNWTLAMRPLRASNASCVMCHTSGPGALSAESTSKPRLGDGLGVALYLYRRSERLERDSQSTLQRAILPVPVTEGVAGGSRELAK